MKKFIILFIFLILFSCNSAYSLGTHKISAEKLKNMQTYCYDTNDSQKVMNAVITTLHDSDFEIQDYDAELGFIRAKKIFKAHYVSKKRIAGWGAVLTFATAYTVFSYGATAYTMYSPSRRIASEMKDKTIVVDTNIFVTSTQDNKTQVRFIPVEKILQNADGFSFMQSAPMRIIRIYKPEIYNEFFIQTKNNLLGIN